MYKPEDSQPELADIPFADIIYDADHPLLRLSAAIDWDNLLKALKQFYHAEHGRPSTPLRAQMGTLMLKSLKEMADRETVKYVKESLYAQRFCGLHPSQVADYMSEETGLSNFRAKIGSEGMALIAEALTAASGGKKNKRGNKLILDTTCVPLDILYPTDIRLLERCRRAMVRLLKKAKGYGVKTFYRTYSRTGRKVFIQFCKKSKPNKETRQRVHKQLFQFVRRNFKQLVNLRKEAGKELGERCKTSSKILSFLQELKEVENRTRVILHQQKQVRQGRIHIAHRIVSFHKDHARPITRGKFPLSTEFGPKALLAVVKGKLRLVEGFYENVSDAAMVIPALRWFWENFGRLPDEIQGDRGFFARWRVQMLKAMGIRPGLQQRGKVLEKSAQQLRMIRQRLEIEAMISLAKRKFGLSRCRARNDAHEISWIGLGVGALNAHRAFMMQPP